MDVNGSVARFARLAAAAERRPDPHGQVAQVSRGAGSNPLHEQTAAGDQRSLGDAPRSPFVTSRRVALIGLATFATVISAEHGVHPELNPLTHQISEYATAPDGVLATAGFAAWSLSLAATAHVAWRTTSSMALAIPWALAASGMTIAALFATQTVAGVVPAGGHITLVGRLHDAGSGITTLAILCAMLVSASSRRLDRRLRLLASGLAVSALVINGALLAVGSEVGGLRQRLLVVIACVWQAAFLLRISRAAQRCSREER